MGIPIPSKYSQFISRLNGSSLADRLRLVPPPAYGFAAALLALISRRPDVVLYPQFWAEDGREYFQQAWNEGGLNVLLAMHGGYLALWERIVAAFATLFSADHAPLVMNLCALMTVAGMAAYLVSDRLADQFSSASFRWILALIIIAHPNTVEIYGCMTNVQWYLAIFAAMILSARPTTTVAGKVFDVVALAIICLTGPFALVLSALSLLLFWRQNLGRRLVSIVPIVGAAIQIAFVHGHPRPMGVMPGVTANELARVFAGQVVAMSFVDEDRFQYLAFGRHQLGRRVPDSLFWHYGVIPLSILGLLILVWGLWKGPGLLKALILIGLAIFGGLLVAPAHQSTLFLYEIAGSRYFAVLGMGLLAAIVHLAINVRWRVARRFATGLTTLAFLGMATAWRIDPWPNLRYVESLHANDQSPTMDAQIMPVQAREWVVHLKRRR